MDIRYDLITGMIWSRVENKRIFKIKRALKWEKKILLFFMCYNFCYDLINSGNWLLGENKCIFKFKLAPKQEKSNFTFFRPWIFCNIRLWLGVGRSFHGSLL
ncbi:hypothetical protein H5410_003411 [Solanum commersonii]|uniref:Uncharacterized protein n=1 Tax=Solanum commersonii TaxID=4109 RepID=A0A9J6B4L2_SOLCO|nr:hypothetical protein H5410_003411 [Solanum commersonii]